MNNNIRLAKIEDLTTIMNIYENAREFMRANGNDNQWINGYPSKELITEDIYKENLYVYESEETLVGVFAFIIGNEASYNVIKGHWTKDDIYGVIHRIGITKRGINIGRECVEYCVNICKYLRIDTHADNMPMRKFLIKNGFRECGVIIIDDGSERIGYDKSLQ